LPVWLYSYQQVKGDKKLLHYVAVNARTKETMGSVPIHIPKLLLISFIVEILGLFLMMFVESDYSWIFLLSGFIYFFIMFTRYRNNDARHKYETETKTKLSNLRKVDKYIESRKGLTNSKINNVNNNTITALNSNNTIGKTVSNNIINAITENNEVASFIKNTIDKQGGNKWKN